MERADVGKDFIRMVFSWSTKDILNNDLYEDKVKQIPRTFLSTNHYLNSFVFPLIEETRTDLCSSLKTVAEAPACEITEIGTSKDYNPPYDLLYNLELEPIEDNEKEGEIFEPESGDIIALTHLRPTRIDDLTKPGESYLIALVQRVKRKLSNESVHKIQILASKPINFDADLQKDEKHVYGFAVYLINMTTNMRIWNALRSDPEGRGMRILKKVLQPDSSLGENCAVCFSSEKYNIDASSLGAVIRSLDLNRSQEETVMSCIAARECSHKNTVKLIWGPPGTGKTRTVSSLLFALLKRKCRTLTCTPTNVSVLEVTSRLLRLVMESVQYHTYGLGDIVLFGNGERMKIDTHDDLFYVFLDYRAHALAKCFAPLSGWKHSLELMISLLENPQKQYLSYLDSQEKRDYDNDDEDDSMREFEMELCTELSQQNNQGKKDTYYPDPVIFNQTVWKKIVVQTLRENKKLYSEVRNGVKYEEEENKGCLFEDNNIMHLTFSEFVKKEFSSIRMQMRTFVVNMCTHLPTSIISLRVVKSLFECLDLLKVFGTLLSSTSISDKEYELALASSDDNDDGHRVCGSTWESKLFMTRKECLKKLKSLQTALVLPGFFDEYSIKSFCLKRARLVFCTVSSSARLLAEELDTLEMLVVDEAAQLKECESTIPLQLLGLRHVVLFGDEKQLPALVKSEISDKAGFGRSLFERLVLLGHQKHLLNVQYRMHPSISLFPNAEFYDKQLLDSPSVKERRYEKCFLDGDIFKSYSFLNVAGQDEIDERGSHKNMVEVAVVSEIVLNLFKEAVSTRQTLSVGVISPYKAQVFAIEEKLGKKFGEDFENFSLKISSVDGFQGGEEDVIIISTVRCNGMGSVGFLSNNQRTNVAITRARYCLWIVGSGETLMNSGSVWGRLVLDAMARGCYHNADDDERLSYAITTALIECDPMDNILDVNSPLFRKARWKVCFNHDFLKSMEINKSTEVRKNVYSLLMQISSGRRQPHQETILVVDDICSQPLELYKVNELLYLVWTIDIIQENPNYIQALKIWDVLPLSEVPKLVRDIDISYRKYPIDVLKCCRLRCSDGTFEVPLTWLADTSNPNYYYLPQADLQLVRDQLDSFGLTDV